MSAAANISLWGSWASCFCHLSRSKPYVVGANLMTLVQIIYLVGLIAVSLMQNLLPIATLKYITAICIFIIVHILFVLLESVAQMYLTFWENKK